MCLLIFVCIVPSFYLKVESPPTPTSLSLTNNEHAGLGIKHQDPSPPPPHPQRLHMTHDPVPFFYLQLYTRKTNSLSWTTVDDDTSLKQLCAATAFCFCFLH